MNLFCSADAIDDLHRLQPARVEADALVDCFDPRTNHCVITPACRLRRVLGEALAALYAALDRYTLEDIVQNRPQLRRLREPRPAAAN